MIDNQVIYKEMVKYLKENKLDLSKDYFSGILKSTGWVVSGHTVKYACDMCSMFYHDSTENGHLDKTFMRKHVRAISKRILQSNT